MLIKIEGIQKIKKMKKLIILLVTVAATAAQPKLQARDYGSFYENVPFEMDRVAQPSIPDYTVTLTDFGGVGDGFTLNTEAFAKAFDDLVLHGGGRLVVPRGIWITGPIRLKSRTELHVSDGALILFTDDLTRFPVIETSFEGRTTLKAVSPVSAEGATDIAITGGGVIDGNGERWRPVKKAKMTAGQWSTLIGSGGATNPKGDIWYPSQGAMRASLENIDFRRMNAEEMEEYKAHFRPVMVSLVNCKNILLQGVTFQNSPAWNVHPLMCENITVDNVIIRNPWYSQNGDGLDLESCKNVLVVDSSFDVGDDAICIKSGKDKEGRDRGMPTENLIVDNCIVYHGHGGFTVGSEMSGGARNLLVRNCTFMGTDVGLRFKSTRGRGGVVENIWIRNIDMAGIVNEGLIFDLYYGGVDPNAPVPPVTEETPSFRNIFISDIVCRGAGTAMLFNGLPEMNVKNVTVDNALLQCTRGIIINQSDGVKLNNVTVMQKRGLPVALNNSENVEWNGAKVEEVR